MEKRKNCIIFIFCIALNVMCRYRVKHPLRAAEFLKALNALLDPTGEIGGLPANKEKTDKAKSKSSKAPKAAHGRTNPLRKLSAFGMSFHHLSKKTIGFLEVRRVFDHNVNKSMPNQILFVFVCRPRCRYARPR